MTPGKKILFLAETVADAESAIRQAEEGAEAAVFVALRPEASYTFGRKGVPFQTRADYFDAEIANRACAENDRRIREFSSRIDGAVREKTGDPHLEPATSCFVSLKILFDVVTADALVLREIVRKEQPSGIHAFIKPRDPALEAHLPFSTEESVYSAILQETTWGIPVTFGSSAPEPEPAAIPPRAQAGQPKAMRRQIRDTLYRHGQLFDFSCVLSRKGPGSAARMMIRRLARGRMTVLLYGSGYNWDDSLEELSDAGVRTIIRLEDADIPGAGDPGNTAGFIRDLCEHDPALRALVNIEGMDLSPVILPHAALFIADAWRDARSAFDMTCRLIRENNVRALLLSTRDTPKGGHVVRAARTLHIPVISWQHGGAGYFDLPIQMYSELWGSDLHLVFGDGVKRTFLSTCKNHPGFPAPALESVGSSSLDAMLIPPKSAVGGRLRVGYISTVYHNNMYYYPFRTGRGDFDESLWGFQRQVLGLALRHQECDFIVKLYPSHLNREPLLSWCADHGCTNVRLVVREQTVADLLADADVLVFDIITTAILQALRTDKPVFVFTGIYRPEEDALRLLQQRAFASPDPESCAGALGEYLAGRPPAGIDRSDDAFLRCFGTHANNGRSAARAAALVRDRIRQHDTGENT